MTKIDLSLAKVTNKTFNPAIEANKDTSAYDALKEQWIANEIANKGISEKEAEELFEKNSDFTQQRMSGVGSLTGLVKGLLLQFPLKYSDDVVYKGLVINNDGSSTFFSQLLTVDKDGATRHFSSATLYRKVTDTEGVSQEPNIEFQDTNGNDNSDDVSDSFADFIKDLKASKNQGEGFEKIIDFMEDKGLYIKDVRVVESRNTQTQQTISNKVYDFILVS